LSDEIADIVTIVISSDGSPYSGYLELTDPSAALMAGFDSGPGARGSLGGLEDLTGGGYPGTWHFRAQGVQVADIVPWADHFVFTLVVLDVSSTVMINVYQEDWETPLVPSFAVIQPPVEPTTIALQGAGVLFLRRRRSPVMR